MSQAAGLLMHHLAIIANVDPDSFGPAVVPEEPATAKRPDWYEAPIESLDLSVRVFNSLKRTGITTIGEVIEMLEKGEDAMLAIRNFGEKSLEELLDSLTAKGYLPAQEGPGGIEQPG
jgi:DNA-directed RNA polymerase subunit alpha